MVHLSHFTRKTEEIARGIFFSFLVLLTSQFDFLLSARKTTIPVPFDCRDSFMNDETGFHALSRLDHYATCKVRRAL